VSVWSDARARRRDGCAPIHHAHTLALADQNESIIITGAAYIISTRALHFWAAYSKYFWPLASRDGERVENERSPLGFFFVCISRDAATTTQECAGNFQLPS
jgi:hypothetical protein